MTDALEEFEYACDVEHKRIVKHNQARVFTHIHLEAPAGQGDARFPIEITLYTESQRSYVFKSSITGKAIERATARELER